MVKKKGKKFRANLNHVARKRRQTEKNKKKCRSSVYTGIGRKYQSLEENEVVMQNNVDGRDQRLEEPLYAKFERVF
ncbi:hypothetical protein Y032_0819g2523 [Ancylostoma ceylanicum]|uniref:Uncharacterized protein n=1 Tax=Ancylostoma ceylanicum TaxID=53326 RepID=A0A016WBF6_9BILA|nr:hypothetical protein Y032_0819g2523 [Ancylostoma ceylanicum]